jgi:hypothetical protein
VVDVGTAVLAESRAVGELGGKHFTRLDRSAPSNRGELTPRKKTETNAINTSITTRKRVENESFDVQSGFSFLCDSNIIGATTILYGIARGGPRGSPMGRCHAPSPQRIYKKIYIVNKKCIL